MRATNLALAPDRVFHGSPLGVNAASRTALPTADIPKDPVVGSRVGSYPARSPCSFRAPCTQAFRRVVRGTISTLPCSDRYRSMF